MLHKSYIITYQNEEGEPCLTQAETQDEAEAVAAELYDDGYRDITIETVRS